MLETLSRGRFAPVVVACALALASCATGQVTTEGAGVATGEATGSGADTAPVGSEGADDDGVADDSVTSDGGQENGGDANSDGASGASDGEGAATGGAYDGLIAVEIIGEPAGMSTDLGQPDAEWGVLNVTDAWIPDEVDGLVAPAGMQFVAINYELYWADNFGNFFVWMQRR